MKKQALTAIEIRALASSNLTAPDERWEPASLYGEDHPSKPEARERAALVYRHLGFRQRRHGRGLCWRLARRANGRRKSLAS
jgi:hypothetical protein